MSARVTTPFGFSSTADDVLEGVDLTGKRAIVTGASSGIGIETARALARAGAEVTLAVRYPERGEQVAAGIRAALPSSRVRVAELDVSSLDSVDAFIRRWEGPLHILVNNAGVMALPGLERTPQGWEMQFATNYLGHFALATGLHPALASAGEARVVSVSSSGNLIAPVLFDDPHFDFIPYDPLLAYGQSKSACALFAVEASRRWREDGISVNALNPGAIATNLQKYTGGLKTPPERRKTIAQGAATSVLLAASTWLRAVGGRYFEDCNEAEVVTRRPSDYHGVARYAVDPDNAARLWSMSFDLLDKGR